jgi:hypothetical protein
MLWRGDGDEDHRRERECDKAVAEALEVRCGLGWWHRVWKEREEGEDSFDVL